MPIYGIDLNEPINFARLTTFRDAATSARLFWEDAIERSDPTEEAGGAPMVILSTDGRPLPPKQRLENLIDVQNDVLDNLSRSYDRIYVALRHKPSDVDFEVVHPIIPDYFWASEEGLKLRAEIDSRF